MSPTFKIFSNRLLCALSNADIALMQPHLSLIDLPLEYSLEEAETPISHVYFLESGIASTVVDAIGSARSRPVEVGITGREGFTGLSVILGDRRTLNSTYMQVGGDGYRMEAKMLQRLTETSVSLRISLLRFVQVFMTQITETALANARSKLEQRLARWLLMADDRCDDAVLSLNHKFLALMLAVRRPGVTIAIQRLEGRGLIEAKRGQIHILDRAGLVEEANGCYGVPEAEYRRLLERKRRSDS